MTFSTTLAVQNLRQIWPTLSVETLTSCADTCTTGVAVGPPSASVFCESRYNAIAGRWDYRLAEPANAGSYLSTILPSEPSLVLLVTDETRVDMERGSVFIVPLRILQQPMLFSYVLYRIQLAFPEDTTAPVNYISQCKAGYYGITGRRLEQRILEHQALMQHGSGYALHAAWRAAQPGPYSWTGMGVVAVTVAGTADRLAAIYDLEEAAVAEHTLSPKGLNVIPGGYAGIRMLHELGLTNKKKLGPEEREKILIEMERTGHAGPCAHYRRGHIRRLPGERETWVRACFVALNTLELDHALHA